MIYIRLSKTRLDNESTWATVYKKSRLQMTLTLCGRPLGGCLPWCLARVRAEGAIWKGDLRTGEGEIVISGGQAAGLDYDRRSGYLFVAGAFTGERQNSIKYYMSANIQACPRLVMRRAFEYTSS